MIPGKQGPEHEQAADCREALELERERCRHLEAELRLTRANLSALIDDPEEMIWSIGLDDRLLLFNSALAEFLRASYGTEARVGASPGELLPPGRASLWNDMHHRVLENGSARMDFVMPDGRIFDLALKPLMEGEGKRGVIVICRDVTSHRHAEQALLASEARYRRITEGLTDYLYTVRIEDGHAVETIQSLACEKVTGYLPEEFAADPDLWLRMILPEDRGPVLEQVRLILEGADVPPIEHRIVRKDGAVRWVRDTTIPFRDAAGKLLSYDGVIQDITEHKLARQELLLKDRLQQLLMNIATTYINLPLNELEPTISVSLRDIGEFVEADRVFIYDYDFERQYMTMTHEWFSESGMSVFERMQRIPLSAIPEWDVAAHRRGEPAWIPDVSSLPPSGLRERMVANDAKSVLGVPLMSGEGCIGFVGFTWVRHHYTLSASELPLLTMFANMLVNIRQRKEAGEELNRHRKHLEELVRERTEQLECAVSELSDARDAADAANRAKSAFLANMSHEIRTPMNAVLGFAQLLERDQALSPQSHEKVGSIIKSGDHLLSVINDILEMSRIEAGRVELRPQPLDLYSVMDDLAVMFRMKAEEKGLAFRIERSPTLPRYIVTDLGKLRQILINLLGNAVKFTKIGFIELSAFQTGHDRLVLEVKDSGIGVTAAEQENLFRPFERARSSAQESGGTGLGLAISREYARLMDGTITVESTPGAGSCFRLEFSGPLATGKPAGGETPQRLTRLAPGQGEIRILVVDDQRSSREVLREMLEPLGFLVDEAPNGLDAVEKAMALRPRVILMDQVMPGMDGDEATRILRAESSKEALPIIGITASAFDSTRQRFLEAGVNAFITKPYREQELLSMLTEQAGIRFEVEEPALAPVRQSDRELPSSACMPAAWHEAFREALARKNVTRIRKLGEEVSERNPALACWIVEHVGRYDLEGLKRLLQDGGR